MILLLHIIIALTSIVFTASTFMSPSKNKLRGSYSLVALTLASGTYLVISTHARLVQACMTGLFYLGVVSFGIFFARQRLASQELNQE